MSSGATSPARAPSLDRHVAHRHATFHRQRLDRRAAVLDDVTDAAAGADLADDREDDVLGRHARWHVAFDVDRHPLRPRLRQRLGGQHVFDLAGADAERQGTERAVGCGVAVAAHDGGARQRSTLLGTDDVDDALVRVAHRVQGDPELGGVGPHRVDLLGRDRVGDRLVDVGRRDVVVLGRHGELGAAHGAPTQAQAVEGLRAGDLVDEVEVDVQQVRFAGRGVHQVAVPDLLRQRVGRHRRCPLVALQGVSRRASQIS